MTESLKIVIPMAGWGTRMRPHTWSKPKPLVSVAGKTSLEHLLDMFTSVPDPANTEYVFILGPYLGELQIPPFIRENFPHLKAHYIVQHEMKGQSHALALAREHLRGSLIICFSDTLMETDFSFLAREQADGVAWVMPVPDPRRFGVAEEGADGWVKRFIEKPQDVANNLVVIGCYYLKSAERLLAAIDEQMQRGIMFKNEYFLTDTISIMIERGARIHTHKVDTWLDTGTIDATLDTNRILLDRGAGNASEAARRPNVRVEAPVFIHPTAKVEQAVIGPHVSIGADCEIRQAVIQDSIIEPGSRITRTALKRSLIGRNCIVEGQPDPQQACSMNLGDNSTVIHPG
ncbi:MAG: nucleotidyltransferase [Chloroflexi bacterium]|nr:nucleotidyltransferase [Chloroflexota bacterium]